MIRAGLALILAVPFAAHAAAPKPAPGLVRVRLETGEGPIVIALEMKRAPITAGNFLAYVDGHKLDGTSFYRAAKSPRDPNQGLVQGGINHNMPRSLPPIRHEPTTVTGLHHVDGTISMARNDPGTAMGDFFIVVGHADNLDAAPNYPGYAAFGHVVSGMPVVRHMLGEPTWPGGWSHETIGQSLRHPVPIVRAVRVK